MIDVVAATAVGSFLADPVRREHATELGRIREVERARLVPRSAPGQSSKASTRWPSRLLAIPHALQRVRVKAPTLGSDACRVSHLLT